MVISDFDYQFFWSMTHGRQIEKAKRDNFKVITIDSNTIMKYCPTSKVWPWGDNESYVVEILQGPKHVPGSTLKNYHRKTRVDFDRDPKSYDKRHIKYMEIIKADLEQ